MSRPAIVLSEEQRRSTEQRDRELAEIRRLLAAADAARGREAKAIVVNEMFTYLATTEQILTNYPSFRATVAAKITEVSREPLEIRAIYADSMAALCAYLARLGTSGIAGCPGAEPLENLDYSVLGAGGYGAVFQPALPNYKNGARVNFPGNVTKIFYRPSNYQKMARKIPRIPELMGERNEGQRINTYTRKYKVSNLPARLTSALRSRGMNLNPRNNVHIVHMPNLGKDFGDVSDIYKELRNRPFRTILTQIQKLIHQTASINAAGYGHFDIRETNIMVTPSTGVLTLVDFDWLEPLNQLMNNYSFGFYNNPPEMLMENEWSYVVSDTSPVTGYYVRSVMGPMRDGSQLHNYLKQNIGVFQNVLTTFFGISPGNEALRNAIQEANSDNITFLREKMRRNYIGRLPTSLFYDNLKYFDNYGLGMTLLYFLSYVYPFTTVETAKASLATRITDEGRKYNDAELTNIAVTLGDVYALLKRMASFKIRDRPTPAEAAAEIDRIVSKYDEVDMTARNAISNNASMELGRLAVMANSNFVVNEANAPGTAIPSNVRAELNRMAVMARGASPKARRTTRRNRK